MAMTFTAIAQDPVLVEEGTFAMNYLCSGIIYAGCAVCCTGATEAVRAQLGSPGCPLPTHRNGFVGVAAYDGTHGYKIAVYGPGNKVRVRASGAIVKGQAIRPVSKGFFKVARPPSGSFAVALENIADGGYGKVLLV